MLAWCQLSVSFRSLTCSDSQYWLVPHTLAPGWVTTWVLSGKSLSHSHIHVFEPTVSTVPIVPNVTSNIANGHRCRALDP